MRAKRHIAGSGLKDRGERLRRFVVANRRRAATLGAGALAAAMAYHVVFGQNGLTAYEHKRRESKDLAHETAALAKENEFFRGHVKRLESDPGAIEHQAREELHYARPGEVIFTLPAVAGDVGAQKAQ